MVTRPNVVTGTTPTVRTVVVGPETDDGPAREAELYEQHRAYGSDTQLQWDNRKFRIKMAFLSVLSGLALAFAAIGAVLLFLLLVYLVVLVVVHYTYPPGWLQPEELARLEKFYTRLAVVIVPVMLMGNAWLIWMVSRRQT